MDKFVSDIVQLHEEFLEEAENMIAYSNDDEHNYIAGKTYYSIEMIELVLWFEECYQMKSDCIEYGGICKKCGSDKLYIREIEDEPFVSDIECGTCGEHYSFDDMYDHDHLYAFYMDEKGRKRNVPTYHSPNCSGELWINGVLLKDFNFVVGTKFLFLYDFGDEWHFTITFDKEVAEKTQCPLVVQYRGEAPEQY